jgi:N-acetylmuramoyl-L-alanine amidase
MKIKMALSPNFDKKKRSKNLIKIIVIHYTGMQSGRESLARLRSQKFMVSSHFFISEAGNIYKLVEENKTAWHAGKSHWGKYKDINKNSIGIELVNKGHRYGYKSFKKKQINSLIKICNFLKKKYKIKNKNIVGHSDVAPLRKNDPGEKFPWKHISKKNIGLWHDCESKILKKFRKKKIFLNKDKKKFIKLLKKIGYHFPNKNKFFLKKVTMSFQRHFRKELINGVIDKECLIIATNLSKKL